MKRLLAVVAALAVACTSIVSSAFADTSYLLIQGPFGSGSTTETYKWKINYTTGLLVTSQDLLNVVFGTPVDSGTTYTDGFGSTKPLWTSGNATLGASYTRDSLFGLYLTSFTIGGLEVFMDPEYNPSWVSFLAGGSGEVSIHNPDGLYDDGEWEYASDGLASRLLANGSFDGWVFGGYDAEIIGVMPLEAYFADAIVIDVIPEPGSVVLALVGITGVWVFGRRNRKLASL